MREILVAILLCALFAAVGLAIYPYVVSQDHGREQGAACPRASDC
jgi:hypothetical protein